jgi:ketosteroid isomerase-like protein
VKRPILAVATVWLSVPAFASDRAAEAEVRALLDKHADAVEKGDFAVLDTIYAPDVIVLENAGENDGWDDYRNHHLKPELAELKDLRYRRSKIRVSVAGKVSWTAFDYDLHAVTKEGVVDVAGKGTIIFRKGPRGWKIVHEHTSGRRK